MTGTDTTPGHSDTPAFPQHKSQQIGANSPTPHTVFYERNPNAFSPAALNQTTQFSQNMGGRGVFAQKCHRPQEEGLGVWGRGAWVSNPRDRTRRSEHLLYPPEPGRRTLFLAALLVHGEGNPHFDEINSRILSLATSAAHITALHRPCPSPSSSYSWRRSWGLAPRTPACVWASGCAGIPCCITATVCIGCIS